MTTFGLLHDIKSPINGPFSLSFRRFREQDKLHCSQKAERNDYHHSKSQLQHLKAAKEECSVVSYLGKSSG
jgi:hypothetical protein